MSASLVGDTESPLATEAPAEVSEELSKHPLSARQWSKRAMTTIAVLMVAAVVLCRTSHQHSDGPANVKTSDSVQKSGPTIPNIISAVTGPAAEMGKAMQSFTKDATEGDKAGVEADALEMLGFAGDVCVVITGALTQEEVALACGGFAVASNVASASLTKQHAEADAGGDASDDIAEKLNSIVKESKCEELKSQRQHLKIIGNQYQDTIVAADAPVVIDAVYANFAEWHTYVDVARFRDYHAAIKGCGEAPSQHVPLFFGARSQLTALEAVWHTSHGADQGVPEYIQRVFHDMGNFSLVQQELCIFNYSLVDPAKIPPQCAVHGAHGVTDGRHGNSVDKLCVENSLLPRDLKQLDVASTCPYDKRGHMGGNVADLPPAMTYIDFGDIRNVTGDVKDLPKTLTFASFPWANIRGSLLDLPSGLTYANFGDSEDIVGNLRDLPRSLGTAYFARARGIVGDIRDLPDSLRMANFRDADKVTGDLQNLPAGMTVANFNFADIKGALKDLPPFLIVAKFSWAGDIMGVFSDLPRSLKWAYFDSSSSITGSFKDLPPGMVEASFSELPDVTGDVSDLPRPVAWALFNSASRITGSLKDLPHGVWNVDFSQAAGISGDFKDLPKGMMFLRLDYATGITGDFKDLPRGIDEIDVGASSAITGDFKHLPRDISLVDVTSASGITGKLEDLPKDLIEIYAGAASGITGDVKDLPKYLRGVDMGAASGITGNVEDLPMGLWKVNFREASGIRGDFDDLPDTVDDANIRHGDVLL